MTTYLFPTSSPVTVCPSTIVNAPIPDTQNNSFIQSDVFTITCSKVTNTEENLFTWKYEVLQYLRSRRRGVDETHVCIFQCFLAVVTPQPESTQHNTDICCHLSSLAIQTQWATFPRMTRLLVRKIHPHRQPCIITPVKPSRAVHKYVQTGWHLSPHRNKEHNITSVTSLLRLTNALARRCLFQLQLS